MRKAIILALVLMVALVAVPAFASTQNVKVSGAVDSTWLYRDNFDFGTSLIEDVSQSVFMTQTQLQVDADLTDQVSATIALINERAWSANDADTNETDIDLNLAYVTLREMLYSPLTVVVGRQAFSYGNSLIVDSAGANNAAPADSGIASVAADLTKQTALDAIRLIFDYNPLTLEVLYAKLDEATATSALDNVTDDIDLYGINATYELGDDLNTQVEGYFFARITKNTNDGVGGAPGSGHATKADTLYVPGLRASADVLDGLNVQGEIAWQRGNNVSVEADAEDNEKREALAIQLMSNYQIPNDILPDALEEYNPAVSYVYTYVSGDSNPTDTGTGDVVGVQSSTNKDTAWDPLLENQSGGKIYNALYNLSNRHIHEVALTVNPMEDVTTKLSWTGLWLDKEFDAATAAAETLVAFDGTNAYAPTTKADESGLGYEVDFDTIYDYTEDVQIGASFGWFVPGDLYDGANDTMASQAIIHGIVNF